MFYALRFILSRNAFLLLPLALDRGLVHEDTDLNAPEESYTSRNAVAGVTSSSTVQAGALTGLAQDQGMEVAVDEAARNAASGVRRRQQSDRVRQLREIVRDSTERWMLPSDDADREYYEELRAMGYRLDEAEEKMQERGKEYHGMLRMGCRRIPLTTPRLISHLTDVRIVMVSAGYAHVMLVSDNGLMFGAGYNDRGQLGLG